MEPVGPDDPTPNVVALRRFCSQPVRGALSVSAAPGPETTEAAVLPLFVGILPCESPQGVHLFAADAVALHQRREFAAEAFPHVIGHQPAVACDLEVVEKRTDFGPIRGLCRDTRGGGKRDDSAGGPYCAFHGSPHPARSWSLASRTFRLAGSAVLPMSILRALLTM